MADTLLNELKGLKRDTVARNSRRSKDWFRNKIAKGSFDKKYIRSRPSMGGVYTFVYSPKHKKTLPYWDRNPLIVVIDHYAGGFLGLNFHYLPPKLRAIFMDNLLQFRRGFRDKARIKVSYGQLKSMASLKYYKPTIKRYLKPYMRSKLVLIPEEEYKEMLFLPYAKFSVSNTKVYKDSRAMI